MHRLPVMCDGKKAYEIVMGEGALFDAPDFDICAGKRVMIVTDDHVAPLYAEALKERLLPLSASVSCHVLPAGERHKTLDEVRRLYGALIPARFDRNDLILALGGGVIGDLAGFAAATYLRGIRFIQIPTTLLSMTDSSIGGKTGVDFDGYKNMVGAFHMPALVYIHPDVLKTLPDRELSSGMAEVIKHGLIRDAAYAEETAKRRDEVFARDHASLTALIRRSCEIKASVVEADPYEKGERALLNFGHTIGHAIEKAYGFRMLHGECVSLGCVAAARISLRRGLIGEEDFALIRELFSAYRLPVSAKDLPPTEEILALTLSDKKMYAGQIRFVLLKRIGEAFVSEDVTKEEMREAVESLREGTA